MIYFEENAEYNALKKNQEKSQNRNIKIIGRSPDSFQNSVTFTPQHQQKRLMKIHKQSS